jgi:hypothetical protein
MSLKRTFLDSGVLISAARGTDNTALKALQILDDSDRAFVSSIFLSLRFFRKPFTTDSTKRLYSIRAILRTMWISGSASVMSWQKRHNNKQGNSA